SLWSVARRLRRLDFTTALVMPNSPRSALEMFLARIPCRIGHARPWRNWLLTDRVTPPEAGTLMRKRSPAEIQRLIGSTSPLPAEALAAGALHRRRQPGAQGDRLRLLGLWRSGGGGRRAGFGGRDRPGGSAGGGPVPGGPDQPARAVRRASGVRRRAHERFRP